MLSSKTVLYLEDEVLIAFDGEHVLRKLGFGSVTVAHSLHQAERAITERLFDLSVLDINLGNGGDSLDFATDLLRSSVKVVFTSAYNRTESLTRNLPAAFVEKPLTEKKMRAAIADRLELDQSPTLSATDRSS